MKEDSWRKQGPCCQATHHPAPKLSRASMSKFFCWAFMAFCLWKGYNVISPGYSLLFLFFQTQPLFQSYYRHRMQPRILVLVLAVLSHPLKPQVKISSGVFLAVLAKYISRVWSPLTASTATTLIQATIVSPQDYLEESPTYLSASLLHAKVYSSHIKVISCHLSA